MSATLSDLFAFHRNDALAIGAPDRPWLTYAGLRDLVAHTMQALHTAGIGHGDRVAIVLPNGPEMAAAFVAIAHGAVTAPLNPACRREEFEFHLAGLGARAVVLAEGYDGPALAAATRLGLAILRLGHDAADAAGCFTLRAESVAPGEPDRARSRPRDLALILHSPGTGSRPRIVPLLHSNLAASAQHVAASLALSPHDRCLNMMPLFHIHGLVAAVAASLAAGASVWCAPGFDALRFFGWLETARPTWYTAVPTMHQAILAGAPDNAEVVERVRLRFIRSSSAPLPARVMRDLSATFRAPVIEAYGMTEAAHQMTANPLPPRAQKPGSVGVPAGPAVRIADERENRLVEDGAGEVVISGPNVTPGYEANEAANAASFFEAEGQRWFRTGDQGVFDADGYLTITGRLGEIINRGGEKVSPLEVDGVLMDHPAVQQVVTFALPHPKLGEEVAAAVVLREGMAADEAAIRSFCAGRLAAFKVPCRLVVLDEIPRDATGRLQRIGLADRLGLTSPA